ncbi:PEP-utilizing enzyme [Allorhizobium ampelinum]|nr:PEP-utilizing enzyme [Allorhizobium ampelinum]
MAIRAREFGIPAVVGAGRHYDKWKTFSVLRCDCRARRVEPII